MAPLKIRNTNWNDSRRIFSTILEIIQDFLKEVKPAGLEFTGEKSDGHDKIYKIIVKKYLPIFKSLGYIANDAKTSSGTLFILQKDAP